MFVRVWLTLTTTSLTTTSRCVPQACVVLELCTPTPQSGHRMDDAPAWHSQSDSKVRMPRQQLPPAFFGSHR